MQAFDCFPVNNAKYLRVAFFMELLLQMFCFTLHFQKDVAEYIVVIHRTIVLSWNLKSLSFAFICFHSLCHSLTFAVPLFVCYSLTLFVMRSHSLSLVVIGCHLLSFVVSLVFIRCHSLHHSLSFVVTRCTTRMSFYKRSSV